MQGDAGWGLDLAISADGGSMFTQSRTSSAQVMPRAMDIIASRIGVRVPIEPRGAARSNPVPMVLLSPSLYVDNSREGYDFSKLGVYTQHREKEKATRFV